jgi:two-component system NtrC family sensor kinase
VAHEINNPLAIINESAGWIHLLLQKIELKNIPHRMDLENALQKIDKSVERAKHITHQLLGIVRNHDGLLSPVDIQELVRESIQLVSRYADSKHVVIKLASAPKHIDLVADPYQLRQVLINLLTNAIHAEHEAGVIHVGLVQKKHEVVITVQDNGIGIPKENKDKIFDPFFTTKNPGEGTGLGLFVTKKIVERIHGHIEFQSSLGHGTTFSVRLPFKTTYN